ncbi:endonuclease I family protein [Crocosphaera sp. XPORK-15E]|uniref:endonuclease I family protein n=1 Tax=Crocosphaera sp. XPORK-15E TaxID=3110247 RepID=UPI002B20DDD7|nr:endonuclease [Crocosphaera sp. XPORK-15E]MEA5532540.1 endonuclease [Crocosphaera sp. XPORK-15E]
MNKIIVFLITVLCLFYYPQRNSFAQTNMIFPELTGETLLNQVIEDYTPDKTLGYDRARDIMYGQIDNDNGVVTGVYTNYQITLDPTKDPSSDAFSKNINAEHIWPQSRGAREEPGRSDLHHLLPARDNVNSARGNKAFAEIPDPRTNDWYRNTERLEFIPRNDIDEYSESNSQNFEPREAKKGDIARAVFYFYTIYREQANQESPEFFREQQEDLCQWHKLDPVDTIELERSQKIAEFQGNENPFIVDATLAERLYCSNNP